MLHNNHVVAYYAHQMKVWVDHLQDYSNPGGNLATPVRARYKWYAGMLTIEIVRAVALDHAATLLLPTFPT